MQQLFYFLLKIDIKFNKQSKTTSMNFQEILYKNCFNHKL